MPNPDCHQLRAPPSQSPETVHLLPHDEDPETPRDAEGALAGGLSMTVVPLPHPDSTRPPLEGGGGGRRPVNGRWSVWPVLLEYCPHSVREVTETWSLVMVHVSGGDHSRGHLGSDTSAQGATCDSPEQERKTARRHRAVRKGEEKGRKSVRHTDKLGMFTVTGLPNRYRRLTPQPPSISLQPPAVTLPTIDYPTTASGYPRTDPPTAVGSASNRRRAPSNAVHDPCR